jgi:hypothetical protein
MRINTKGKIVIPAQFQDAGFFLEGVAVAKLNELACYITPSGKFALVPIAYDAIDDFHEGYALYQQNGKVGLLQRK